MLLLQLPGHALPLQEKDGIPLELSADVDASFSVVTPCMHFVQFAAVPVPTFHSPGGLQAGAQAGVRRSEGQKQQLPAVWFVLRGASYAATPGCCIDGSVMSEVCLQS